MIGLKENTVTLIFQTGVTNSLEVATARSFLQWNMVSFKEEESHRLLKFTHGKPIPVLVSGDDQLLAAGFFAIQSYITSRGLLIT